MMFKQIPTKLAEKYKHAQASFSESNQVLKWGFFFIGFYLLIATIFGVFWSFERSTFDVVALAREESKLAEPEKIAGVATTVALIGVVDTLLHKPGGYISNDITPPGLWLDNIPNWEYGIIIQTRDLAKAMREAYSRSQSQSTEDKSLALAESRFNFDHNSWIVPSTEGEYKEGITYLREYLARLSDESQRNAQFYARSDNLRYWLSTVETRLGSLSQRLSASVGQRRINLDLANDRNARQSTDTSSELRVKTPWLEIDDVFYEARGSAWALIHFLKAVEIDFAEVLEDKNARVSLRQIIRELEATQQTLFPPMVLNGSGFGMFANHSLVMASYLSRANAAIIDLRELLAQG